MSGRLATLAAALLAAACGTNTKDHKEPPRPPPPAPAAAVAPPSKIAPRAAERVAYSLADNRLAAHVERAGALVLPAGSAGFVKYVRFGNQLDDTTPAWLLQRRHGEVRVARIAGQSAAVHVPLTAAQAARATVRVRAPQAQAGPIRLRVNGSAIVEGTATPDGSGWAIVAFAAPQLREGENAIELIARDPSTAIAWIEVGGEAGAPPPKLPAVPRLLDADRRALALPGGGGLSWYVLVPDSARLTASVDPGCTVRVRATADSGAAAEGTLTGAAAAVDLSALAGRAARVELTASGCAHARVADAAITVPGTVPVVPRGAPPSFIVFVVIDSLRFDRVHAFEPSARAETPVLDRLGASSAMFINHYVQGNESQVSHASMWTSAYLAKHRAARWTDTIAARFVTLDEVARRAGRYVAGATGNGYIRPSRGFGEAWHQFTNHIEQELGLRGDQILERGLGFIAPRHDRPWFLYLGLIDTHVAWRAKQPWIDRYDPDYTGRFAKVFGDDGDGFPKDLTDREKAHVRALYDSNVSYQDELLGRLVAQLEQWGVWDRTMLVVTADHGDEQWENGRVGHESGQDDTLLHVPLLIHYPPLFPPGRVAHASEGIDILPTIAEALGAPADPAWQGASLIPVAHGVHVYPGLTSSSEYEQHHGARIGPWKLRLAGTAEPSLFHLTDDPHETRNVFGTPATLVGGRLVLDAMAQLRAHHTEWRKSRWGNPANVSAAFAADLGE